MSKKFTPTEEQLTAWVLGELDAAEAKQVAEAVNASAELRAVTDEIQATIELSEAAFSELHAADAPELSSEQGVEIAGAASSIKPFMKQKIRWRMRVAVYGPIAASLGIMLYLTFTVFPTSLNSKYASDKSEQLAKLNKSQREGILIAEHDTADDVTLLIKRQELPLLDESRYGNDLSKAGEELSEIAATPAEAVRTDVDNFAVSGKVGGGRASIVEKEEGKKNKDDSFLYVPVRTQPSDKPNMVREEVDQLKSLGYLGDTHNVGGAAGAPGTQVASANPSEVNAPTPVNLQNVVAGSNIRIRDNYFEDPNLDLQDTFHKQVLNEYEKTRADQKARLKQMNGTVNSVSTDGRFRMADVPEQQWRYVAPQPPESPGTESYDRFVDNTFKSVGQHPLSTFSIDVDTASYANTRRFLNQGSLPPMDAVRVEEMINYFNYNYPGPVGEDPFSVHLEVGAAPWQPAHRLVRVGLKGHEMASEERPPTNLVFLLDVSGSMNNPNKLPLVKQAIRMLTKQLDERDRVAIAVYAGSSGLVLPSTSANDERAILDAIERLNAGGSTNGGAGIELAYNVASQNFIEGGVNRVILATDGDFNVGTTSQESLVNLIEQKAKSGVFLSVLGFGMGNLKDATMEKLADKGNGNYAYIDTFREAKKVLVDDMTGTLVTIAKDVKIQVEFNPTKVKAYRLIGYENRALANRDFNDDTKDAGEIGAGHTVTALYEIVPVERVTPAGVDPLRYRDVPEATIAPQIDVDSSTSNEMLTVKLRYKQPDGNVSKLLKYHLSDNPILNTQPSTDFQFASAVAAFGQKLRRSPPPDRGYSFGKPGRRCHR